MIQRKSKRTETINWNVRAGVHFKHIVVMRGGKNHRDLPGSAREVTVSMIGLPRSAVVIKIIGSTGSGTRYAMARTYHLCAAVKPSSGKAGSGYLAHS